MLLKVLISVHSKNVTVPSEVKELPRERPPWVRLVLISGQPPFNVRWAHLAESCAGCGLQTVFGGRHGQGHPIHGKAWFEMSVCFACGLARVPDGTTRGATRFLTGNQWTPPCPAVKRLRRLAFTEPMAVRMEYDSRG